MGHKAQQCRVKRNNWDSNNQNKDNNNSNVNCNNDNNGGKHLTEYVLCVVKEATCQRTTENILIIITI